MHLTTLVSLLAAGAAARPAAAPVARSLDLNTRMPMPTMSKMALPSDSSDLFKGLQNAKAPEVTPLARRQDETEEPTDSSSSSVSSSSSSSADDGLGGLIPGILRARQEAAPTAAPVAAEDPLEDYLMQFDGEGDYDEKASDAALDRYNASIDKENEEISTSSSSAAPASSTPVPETVHSEEAVQPAVNETASHVTEERPTEMSFEKLNSTATNATAPAAPLSTAGGHPEDVNVEEMMAKLNTTSTETPAPTNETSSAVPEPTATKASSDPLAKLQGLLPIKRADIPELPTLPALSKRILGGLDNLENEDEATDVVKPILKRQLAGLMDDLEKTRKDYLGSKDVAEKNATVPATPATEEKNVTAPAVPAVEPKNITAPAVPATEEKNTTTPALPAVDAKNVTSAVNETASSSSEDGYHGINKHMAKLAKLPIGGLPIKRQAPEMFSAPTAEPEVANAQPTGALPSEPEATEPEVAEPEVEISRPEREDRESRTSYQISGADSPLKKHLVPLQNSQEKVEQAPADVEAAAPSEEEPVELSQ